MDYTSMSAKKTAKDRKRDRHRKRPLPARTSESLRAALEALAKAERRSLTQQVEILLEDVMRSRGLWGS